ncbi:hypothetical protein [Rhizobium sp. S163]|uniref:hypothetical protein n=1 Tax=Rhizobium sp. S163 TaxID=3055039 RepID=UPI0025A9DAEC|nr:hypothetical protein [Rhizobium sp. S163]MDM9643883.1 hypothetical protein [Rhizobium sp. S163]
MSFDSNAGIVGAVKRAFMLPVDAMAGEVDPTSDEGIARATEFAGVFSPMSPAAGTGKAIAAAAPRPAPSQGMEAAGAASRLGVDLPRAVASDSPVVQQTGKVLSNVPIGGTPLRTASKNAIDQIGDAATRVQEGYGSGNPANAGAAARQGITTFAKTTLPDRVKTAYDGVDALITQNVTTPLTNTAKIATDITARRANASLPESGAVNLVRRALDQKDGLNYQGIKDLRTNIGETLKNPQSITASGFSEAELKQIYGGLSDDLKAAVARGGGEKASAAFESANQLAAKTAREREGLQKVLGKDASDERIFDKITAMANSNSRGDRVAMARVRGAVSDETWNDLASGVIAKLGRDADGNFSPDRFVTGWGRLSQEGKTQLFGGKKELSTALDDIATVSRQFKTLNQYANPSGTGQSVIGASYLSGALLDPTTVVGSVVGARVLSSIMSKPTSARALAAYTKAYQRQAVAPTAQSTQLLENTSRALAAYIGHETGDPSIAQQIFPSISGVRQMPADQGSENNGQPERQDEGVNQQLRVLMPNET